MHVLYLLLTVVVVAAILWFGMPWVFETIHEPFQGGQTPTCRTPDAINVLPPPPAGPADDWGSYIEQGKQIYNKFGYGEHIRPEGERMFKDRITPEQLRGLNEDIQQALVNVGAVPDSTAVPESARPNVRLSPSGQVEVINRAKVMDPSNNWNKVKVVAGYVEEQVPPTNLAQADAVRCESVNLFTTYTAGGEVQDRTSAIKRVDMCNMLGTRDSAGTISELRPEIAGCGVCIKEGNPVSTSWKEKFGTAMKYIGGMLFTNKDRDAYNALVSSEPSAKPTPSLGSCADGYFFVAGEKDKCLSAARRLNCEEYGESGGFGQGRSNDGQGNADLSGLCVACPGAGKTKYVYNDGTAANVQIRITVPKGTGKTFVRYAQKAIGSAGGFGNFSIVEIDENTSNVISLPNANPNDDLMIDVFQEYPHRPRGLEEVFFVRPARTISTDKIFEFASQLNCKVATVDQLEAAYRSGAQAKEAGYALVVSSSTYVPYTIRQYNNLKNTTLPNPTNKQGVQVASEATGIWCFGFKPRSTYLLPYNFGNETKGARMVSNFFTYIELANEDGLSADNRKDRFSQHGDTLTTPQYHGLCVQFETSAQTTNKRAIPAETFIMRVGETDIRNSDGSRVAGVDPLVNVYSRNGTFADSQRILGPKPTTDMSGVLTNQYWLWTADAEQSGFKIQLKIPGIFANPSIGEDLPKCPTGPLYTSRNLLNFVELSACSDGMTVSCMIALFEKVGTIEGTWHPSKEAGRQELEFKDSRSTIKRTFAELEAFLTERKAIALGTSPSLAGLTVADKAARMNEASMQLLGTKIISECQTLDETGGTLRIINRTGTLPAACLNEIYKQTTASTYAPATYTSIAERYSGLRTDELALPEVQSAFPYRTCQPTGSWAPIRSNGEVNDVAVAEINANIATTDGADSVAKARSVLDQVYQTANSSADKAAQQLAIERCYGIKKKEFVSNCQGIRATNIRVLSILPTSQEYTYIVSVNSIYWYENNSSGTIINIRTGRMSTLSQVNPIVSAIQSVYSNATIISKDLLQTVGNLGYELWGTWAKDTDNSIKKMHISTDETTVTVRPDSDTTALPLIISLRSSDAPSDIIRKLMAALPDNIQNNIPQKSVQILTRLQVEPPPIITLNTTPNQVRASPVSTKVFILGNKGEAYVIYKNQVSAILTIIKGIYSNAALTSEDMLLSFRNDKKVNMCAYGWYQPKNKTEIVSGYVSSEGYINYGWCGGGDKGIIIDNWSDNPKRAMYITLTTSDNDRSIIQKITDALASTDPFSTNSKPYLQKVYDELEYGGTYATYDYTVPVDTTIQTLTLNLNNQAIVQLLKDTSILTQRLATGTTLELNQIDLLPALAYRDLVFPAPGTQKIRMESFAGQGWFLTQTGVISNTDTRTTFTLKPRSVGSTVSLGPSPSTRSPTVANVSKIYGLEGGVAKFLTRNVTSTTQGIVVEADTSINSAWVIRPALNGASAFVSLELANYPNVFLITQINSDGTYTPKCVQYDTKPTELQKALACWRLYPSDA